APQLREVRLKGSGGDDDNTPTRLGTIVAPHLETFVHISSGLDKSVPIDIGKASLPELRRLELYIGQEDYGNTCKVKSFAGILEGAGLPRLEHLGIVNSEWEKELIVALAKSPLVKRLKTLDLSKGILFREGAAALLEHAAAFRHLELLDVSDNYLEAAECKAIKKAIPRAHVDDQKEVEDWDGDHAYRYVTVGE
ncbi:MAG: molybdenum metabolism regulator, partial [Deltaproteobacteria bacterium]|nr:molybdenum metabolism regulator [Deltaproteobacteria bacterium]